MIRNIFIYLGILAIAVVPSFGAIVINEIRTAEPATDDEEFVELYDGGVTSSLVSLELRLINGANGAAFDTIALTSLGAMPGDGYLVVAGGALVPNTDLDDGPNTNFLQNGDPDGVILVDTGASPEVVLDAVSYFTTFSGAGVPNNGAMAADKYEGAGGTGAGGIDGTGTGGFIFNVQMGTAAPTTRTNTGFGRYPDGTDTDDNQTDIDNIFQLATPGTANGAGFLAGPITEDFSQATGLNREWSGAFTPVVLDDPASSEPASIGPSPDPITPNEWASVKDGTGGGDSAIIVDYFDQDYTVSGSFYCGTISSVVSPDTEVGALMARVTGKAHRNNSDGLAGAYDVTSPVGLYGGSWYAIETDYRTGDTYAVKVLNGQRTLPGGSTNLSTGWHTFAIRCEGGIVEFGVDGVQLDVLSGETPRNGYVGVGYRELQAVGEGTVRNNFDDFSVTAPVAVPVELSIFSTN